MKTIEGTKKEFSEYIKKNAMGQVCECGGGGTVGASSETCKQCDGCGIYEWEVYDIENFIEQKIKELLDELCDELEEWHNKVLGDDIQTMADKAAQAVREDLKKYDN